MMALTVRSLDHAARGLASFIPSKYGFSLGSCEKSFGSVFVEDYVLPVPDLAHEFHVAQGRFCMVRVDGSDIDCLRLVRSEEHTSELQSRGLLVCRLLHEKIKY